MCICVCFCFNSIKLDLRTLFRVLKKPELTFLIINGYAWFRCASGETSINVNYAENLILKGPSLVSIKKQYSYCIYYPKRVS